MQRWLLLVLRVSSKSACCPVPKLALIELTNKAVCAVNCYALDLWQIVSCKAVQALSLLPSQLSSCSGHTQCLGTA